VYELHVRVDEVALHAPDQSGYVLRCCRKGYVEARPVSHTGELRGEAVELTPEAFLRSHPEVAQVPGVGAALFRLTSADPASAAERTGRDPGRREDPRRSTRHMRPVLRARGR